MRSPARPGIESHDPGTRPLPDGAAWWANQQSSRLPHRFFRSDGVPEPEGPASLERIAGGSPDAVRKGISKIGGMVVVHGASGPWGRPHGLMEMRAVRRITDSPMGPVTTEMWHSSSSSRPSPPNGLMMKGHGPVQPSWDNPNRGWHTAHPDNPLDGCRGPRAPSTDSSVGWGKGTGAAPTLNGVAWLKVAVVEMQGWQPCGGGAGHHDDHGGGGVGRRLRAVGPRLVR
jgi:hypothetical protein